MFAINFGCFCEINYFWLPFVQLLAHTNLGGISEFSHISKCQIQMNRQNVHYKNIRQYERIDDSQRLHLSV